MKNIVLITILSILCVGCTSIRPNTEQYIKNNLENHKVNEFSEIQIYNIFKGTVLGVDNKGEGYLELVGYKYNGEKGLVISSDKFGVTRKMFENDPGIIRLFFYNTISLEDCIKIIEQYKVLKEKGDKIKGKNKQTQYIDYTISEDCFISIEIINKNKYNSHYDILHLWLNGNKFSLNSNLFIENLKEFINWVEN